MPLKFREMTDGMK